MVDEATGVVTEIRSPAEFPMVSNRGSHGITFLEPVVRTSIITPDEYLGKIMDLCVKHRGRIEESSYLAEGRVLVRCIVPFNEVVVSFFDQLKSTSSGYASFDYEDAGDEAADLCKLELRINGEAADPLAQVCLRSQAETQARAIAGKLRKEIERQSFEVVIQAVVGNKVLARERIAPYRKDVLTKGGKTMGGGDITRKQKLLKKQKLGKKRMKMVGSVPLSNNLFLKLAKR
jgi:GTP-binding protein LepA